MKKLFLVISLIFVLTGCTNVRDLSYDEIMQNISTRSSKKNVYRTGYKYFLPRGMSVDDSTLYNEVLNDGRYVYYLYVDVVSYFNGIKNNYVINNNAVYSRNIEYDNKYGYVEINLIENDKYLVEIMYNYAKIEVIVDEYNCNETMLSAINILKSIEYNNSIIANLLGDDILNFSEEEFNVFEVKGNDDNYIQADEDYEHVDDDIPDTDLIN